MDDTRGSYAIAKNKCRIFTGNSAIYGIAHWVPENIKTVDSLESDFTAFPGSNLELRRRAGLEEKRISSEDSSIFAMAMNAVNELNKNGTFDNTEIPAQEIDLIIYCGVCREYEEPATAILIQEALGLSGIMAFDVSNACLGFSDALCIADSMITCGRVNMALIVSAEKGSAVSNKAVDHVNSGEGDITNQFASLTLGDGSIAALVGEKNACTRGLNLVAGIRKNYSEFSELCILKERLGIMISDPKPLFSAALEKFSPMVNAVLDAIGWNKKDIDQFITHQVSVPATIKGAEILGVPDSKVVQTFPLFGNIASVSLPLTLSYALQNQNDWPKQKLLAIGFGSGLSMSVFAFESTV